MPRPVCGIDICLNSVNEIFDPDKVDDFYALGDGKRSHLIAENRSTNYSVVRPELLDRLYEMMYTQRLRNAHKDKWRCQMKGSCELSDTTDGADGKVHLHFVDPKDDMKIETVEHGFDLVFVASGYTRDTHLKILEPVQHLFEHACTSVDRDYRLRPKVDTVDPSCGIWLQGCCEASHGVSRCLASPLASYLGCKIDC